MQFSLKKKTACLHRSSLRLAGQRIFAPPLWYNAVIMHAPEHLTKLTMRAAQMDDPRPDHDRLVDAQQPTGAPELVPHALTRALRACRQMSLKKAADPDAAPRPLTIVIAVSGGADSVCLLHALAQMAQTETLVLHVAHLDHSLRDDSAHHAAFVADMAKRLELAFHLHRLAPDMLTNQPGGIEKAARDARYEFLRRVAVNVTPPPQVPVIALAHNADDQAETVLLHLVRGAGLQGLRAMDHLSVMAATGATTEPAPHLLRPLLEVNRTQILAYLQQHQLTWCEDSSNTDQQLARNYVRHTILPALARLNPAVTAALGRTARIVGDDANRLHRLDSAALGHLTMAAAPGVRLILDADQLGSMTTSQQRGVVRHALSRLAEQWGETSEQIGFDHVEQILTALRAQSVISGGPHPLPGALAWSSLGAYGQTPAQLSLHRATAPAFAPTAPTLPANWTATALPQNGCLQVGEWRLTVQTGERTLLPPHFPPTQMTDRGTGIASTWETWLDADQLRQPVLTAPHPGLRVAPLGMDGHRKSIGDLFTDRKVPHQWRAQWPVILDAADGSVSWLCGIQIAHHARIMSTTSRVLHLCWHMEEQI